MESTVVWKDGMAFEAELGGFHFTIDAAEAVGGRNLGPMPKGLTLTSLVGCTAMDVISILNKMRVPLDRFEVTAKADLADQHPKKFERIVIQYKFYGQDVPLDRVKRAVTLSQERYCGVSATLAPVVDLSYEIYINDVAQDLD